MYYWTYCPNLMWKGYQQPLKLHIGCILINIWIIFITTNNRGNIVDG